MARRESVLPFAITLPYIFRAAYSPALNTETGIFSEMLVLCTISQKTVTILISYTDKAIPVTGRGDP
jgi:hypothetical protein